MSEFLPEGEALVRNCDLHGVPRRECVICLGQWVDDLLETQTWHHRAHRDLLYEVSRLRRLLSEHGIEEPPLRFRGMTKRRPDGPPPPDYTKGTG